MVIWPSLSFWYHNAVGVIFVKHDGCCSVVREPRGAESLCILSLSFWRRNKSKRDACLCSLTHFSFLSYSTTLWGKAPYYMPYTEVPKQDFSLYDRKSGGWGKGVVVRVDHGGCGGLHDKKKEIE